MNMRRGTAMSRWAPMYFVGVAFAVVFVAANPALGHSGGTDANGCHAGSQPYHCHGSRSAPAPRAPSSGLTVCADGTWSQSTGSGTCSWHGGIAGNNNPSTSAGSSSSGGGTGRIVPGSRPVLPADAVTPSVPRGTQSSLSDAVFDFFVNGGVIYLLIGWFVVVKIRDSRSKGAPKGSTGRSGPARLASSAPRVAAAPTASKTARRTERTDSTHASHSGTGACSCGGGEVVRRNRNTGQRFYGCSRYPQCRRTRPIGRSA